MIKNKKALTMHSWINFDHLVTRLITATLGAILMRFPFFSFQIGVAHLQKKSIWSNDFEVACISDCRVYGELAVGYDRPGTFTWTYFPIWPNLVVFFKKLLPPDIGGYGSAVILSWIIGTIADSEPLFIVFVMAGLLAINSNWLVLAGFLIGMSSIVRPRGVWLPPIWITTMIALAYDKKLSWSCAVIASAVSGDLECLKSD